MLKFDLFEQTTKTSKGMLHNAGNQLLKAATKWLLLTVGTITSILHHSLKNQSPHHKKHQHVVFMDYSVSTSSRM